MVRVFLTGGTGFVGGAFLDAYASTHDITALARSEAGATAVDRLGGRALRGSLETITAANLAGCDAVVHCAAEVGEWAPPGVFNETNVEGTRRLLEAAGEAEVPRFVHVSTDSVLLDKRDLIDVDETTPPPERHHYEYSASKAVGEQLVVAAASDSLHTVTIRPTLVWGPGDTTILPEIAELARSGQFFWIGDGSHRISTTHVANAAHALELALSKGTNGGVYFVTDDEPVTQREFLTRYLATAGVTLPDRKVSPRIAWAAATAVERLWRTFARNRKPPVTRFAIDTVSHAYTVDITRARTELGYEPIVTIDAGMTALA